MFLTHTRHNGHANLPVAIISQHTNVLHHHVMDLQCRECGSHTSEKVRKITLIEEVCTVALVRQRRGQMENSSVPSVMSWHSQMANRFWERTVDYCWLLSRQKSSLAPSCTSFPLPNPPLLVPNLHQRAPSGTVFLTEVDTHSE